MYRHAKIFVFLIAMLVCPPWLYAQESAEPNLFEAFRQSDANSISAYFNDNVEMALPTTDNFYSRQQARVLLSEFFKRNHVKQFNIEHKGNRANSAFTIGTLVTEGGDYRVSFFARRSPKSTYKLIYQLRIERNNP